uniref:Uncharacterized protein n=1 Tax=viral metagenome TaxID=1070528 RepID=A0A6M3JL44_9ZZZZ
MNSSDLETYLVNPSTQISSQDCMSTHGAVGYANGSYFDGDDIICGVCGTRIRDPRPTGWDAYGNPRFGAVLFQDVYPTPDKQEQSPHSLMVWLGCFFIAVMVIVSYIVVLP